MGQKGYCGHRWRTVIKAEGEKAVARIIISRKRHQYFKFLASQDALEVMLVSQSVSQSVTLRTKLTDVALVSEDIN